MSRKMTKECAKSMGLTWRMDELERMSGLELQRGYIIFNIPNPGTPGNPEMESVWAWTDPESKKMYDDDTFTGKLTAVLCENSGFYGGILCAGIEVVILCNGEKRPVLDPDWVREKLIYGGLYTPPQCERDVWTDMTAEEICRAALSVFGADAQTLMMFEEMSELQKELCKHARGRDNHDAIAGEIADVEIMLEQMKLLYDCTCAVEKFRTEKPVLFTDRAKEIIREISGYSHMTGLWQKCQQEAETCYGRKKTPEQIFMAMVCNAADAPTAAARDCILIGHMPHLSRALGLEEGNYV